MARRATISDQDLIARLTQVFRDVGYEGASLAVLSEATGLKKASLYHRFPDGKEQMAREVLSAAGTWVTEHILQPLQSHAPPEDRVRQMIKMLDQFYSGGKQACLLNMLSSPDMSKGPFVGYIKASFKAWTDALVTVLMDTGFEKDVAKQRAERAIALLQGGLVLSRGMGTTRPFKNSLKDLERELIGTCFEIDIR
jgi:AcrR family transcriptional regulator